MIRKLSTGLLILAGLSAMAFIGWILSQWNQLGDEIGVDRLAVLFQTRIQISLSIFILGLLGYLLSFDTRIPRRPYLLIFPVAFLCGGAVGLTLREAVSAYELIMQERPELDYIGWILMLGGGALPVALVFIFEAANRSFWPKMAQLFDRRQVAQLALFSNWMTLLFHPGQAQMLKSVALARFRKGNRTDAVDVLQNLHEAGKADADVLEALCKYSNEQKDSRGYLVYLAELYEKVPGEPEIREALLDELVAQERMGEALALMERDGYAETPEGLERYARALLAQGRLEKATEVAGKLGEMEGIPFRRSQTLLRDVLSRLSEYVPALNLLAAQAERMALRDQRIRWLEKSLDSDPRQKEVRRQLIKIYRELGQSVRLEELLKDEVRERPEEPRLLFEFAEVLYHNEKEEEALKELEKLNQRKHKLSEPYLLQARILFESDRWDEASKYAQWAMDKEPGEAEAKKIRQLMAQIERAVLSAEVVALLEQARENPDDLSLQLEALRRLLERGHAEKVVALVDELTERHPDVRSEVITQLQEYAEREDSAFPILNLLTDLLANTGRYDEALDIIRTMASRALDEVATVREGTQKILRHSPHHLPTLKYLGDVYSKHGRFTEMIHHYSLYLANGGDETVEVDHALARAYISLRDFENAQRFVSQLLEMKAGTEKLIKQMLNLALDTGHAEEAAEYMKQLELIDARDPELKTLRPKVQTALGQRRFSFLKRELEAGKGGSELLEQLGDIARDLSNFSDAITYYQRASRDREDESLARRCTAKLAYCYMKKRLDDLCTETLRNISITLEDDPEDLTIIMDILYEIGEMMLEYKLYDKAERVFKQLCRIDAGYRDVLQRIESLRH